ncbi:MAG: hypothetical protein L0387_09510 [Acidobacteria bacterium]|nr:hypothetical protein [Acidobacteriota bacterium]
MKRQTKTAAVLCGLAFSSALGLAAVPTGSPVVYNGHSYYLLTPDTWTASEAEALRLGGHLVTINDAAENQWVFATFHRTGQYGLWIGLNDEASEGTFVWSSGEPVTFTDWAQVINPQPSVCRCENYGMIFVEEIGSGTVRAGQWNDFRNTKLEGDTFGGVLQGVVEVATNTPPVAKCKNVIVPAGPTCSAAASVDDGSFDPDGDSITITQLPLGPYAVGATTVTLTITDSKGTSSSCTATVTVLASEAASFQSLGNLPGGDSSQAYAVSADGSVVVGISSSESGDQAFRWTSKEGMIGLGYLPGREDSTASPTASQTTANTLSVGVVPRRHSSTGMITKLFFGRMEP